MSCGVGIENLSIGADHNDPVMGRSNLNRATTHLLTDDREPSNFPPDRAGNPLMSEFKQYRRRQKVSELRPYVEGEDLEGVSISAPDRDHGSPKPGDMIARNPKNHDDKWLMAEEYFVDNFETRPLN